MCNLARFQETFWSIQALFIHERQLSELGRYEHEASITALTHSSCIDCASHSSLGENPLEYSRRKKKLMRAADGLLNLSLNLP